jgi:hypothetical protein
VRRITLNVRLLAFGFQAEDLLYRRGNANRSAIPRVKHFARKILNKLTILISPVNRIALEAECAQAKGWYLEHQR